MEKKMTTAVTDSKPLLPSFSNILNTDRSHSEPVSPLLDSMKRNFRSDTQGIIRLPPLGINRPKSVESALRHTVGLPSINSLTNHSPPNINSNNSNAPTPLATTPLSNLSTMLIHDDSNKENEHPLTELTSPKPIKRKMIHMTPSTPSIETKIKSENENNNQNNILPLTITQNSNNSKKIDMITPLTAVKAILTPSSDDKKRAFAFITHSKDTFGVKEPKIDNAPLARRKRRRTSTQELNILQAGFNKCSTPDKRQRLELAERCNMTEKAVQIWFQNKRQAMKRQKMAKTVNITTDNDENNINHNNNTNNSHIHSTPIATKISSNANISISEELPTPQLQIPISTKIDTTPTKNSRKSSRGNSPIRHSITTPNSSKKGQALTFHLRNDKKILTPIKTSPNNKVNKLINGYNVTNSFNPGSSPSEHKFRATNISPNKHYTMKLQFKGTGSKIPLRELDTNIFKS